MPNIESVENGLYSALAESRGSTSAAVRNDVAHGGEIDSLEGVELIVAAESQYGIRIDDDEITPRVCRSVHHLAELVVSKIGA